LWVSSPQFFGLTQHFSHIFPSIFHVSWFITGEKKPSCASYDDGPKPPKPPKVVSSRTLATLVRFYGRSGDIGKAFQIFREMPRKFLGFVFQRLSKGVFNRVLGGLKHEKMCFFGVEPSKICDLMVI
jgi:pentatricopeptide repeat protein